MYYEEKLIDGVWHYRVLPFGDWMPMSVGQLNKKISELKAQVDKLSNQQTIAVKPAQ